MNPFSRLIAYLRSSKVELEKVSWPGRQDVVRYSSLIVVVSLAAAVFFALLDTGLQTGIHAALARKTPLTTTTEPVDIPADSLQVTTSTPAATNNAPVTTPETTNVITGQPQAPTPTR